MSNLPVTSSSPFTKNGLLVGVVEYGLLTTVARWILVAFLSDLALRMLFKRRIGLFLVVQVSFLAGLQAWKANHGKHHSPTVFAKLITAMLFFLAFLVTRGIDLTISNAFTLLQRSNAYQVGFVTAANTDAEALATFSATNEPSFFSRTAVYHALYDITADRAVGSSVWPESIGALSAAEVAAVTAAYGKPCTLDPVAPKSTGTSPAGPAVARGTADRLNVTDPFLMSLYGETIYFTGLFLSNGVQNAQTGVQQVFGYTLPISAAYYVAQEGRSLPGQHSRQQFGVISNPDDSLGAYDMECGLDMVGINEWLSQRLPEVGKPGVTFQYSDLHDPTKGVSAAVLVFSKNLQGQVEVLSVGAQFFSAPRTPFLDTLSGQQFYQAIERGRTPPIPVVTTVKLARGSVSAECVDIQDPKQHVSTDRSGVVRVTDKLSKEPKNKATDPGQFMMQKCNITLPNSQVLTFEMFDKASSATQVCRTKVRRYAAMQRGERVAFNHFVSTRYTALSSNGEASSLLCLPRVSRDPLARPKRPYLPLANFDGKWGFDSSTTLRSSNTTTNDHPWNGQAWFVRLVLIPWWVLGVIGVAALYLVTVGSWSDLAEIVATILYAFTFRPVPPEIAHRLAGKPSVPPSVACGLQGIPLTQPTEFALVDHACDATGEAYLEMRMVPQSWKVQPGDNLAPFGSSRSEAAGALHEPGWRETVIKAKPSFVRLIRRAKKTKLATAATHGQV